MKQFCAIFIVVECTWASVLETCLGIGWLGLELKLAKVTLLVSAPDIGVCVPVAPLLYSCRCLQLSVALF